MNLIQKADQVQAERNKKYHGGGVKRDDYWRYYGRSAIITELHRKVLTLISLDKQGEAKPMLKELPDIVNYSRFLWDLITKGTTK